MNLLEWTGDILLVSLPSVLGYFALVLSDRSRAKWHRNGLSLVSFSLRVATQWSLFSRPLTRLAPSKTGARDVWNCAEWLDTASTALEAGLGLLQAYRLATSLLAPSEVRFDFARAEEAFLLGSSFSASLTFACENARTDPAKRTLVALQRSQSLGSQASESLVDIRDSLQSDLAALHQERVARLPVQMLFPLAAFVLPALLLLVCAPLVAEFASLLLNP
jgi:hypothetical protein